MSLFATLAELAEQLAIEPSRLRKRAAIAQAIAAVHSSSSPANPVLLSETEGPASAVAWSPSPTPNPVILSEGEAAAEGPAFSSATEDPGLFAQYLAGLPFAEADPRKLNAGGALLSRAVLTVTGATNTALTAAYRQHGDLGAATHDLLAARKPMSSFREAGGPAVAVAHSSSPPQKTVILSEGAAAAEGPASSYAANAPTLILTQVAEAFAAIATARTTAIRAALVEDLLYRATPLEAKYLVKLMLGDMRIGVKQSLIEEAIAVAANVPLAQVRHAVMLEADLAAATARAFANTLSEARMRLFHPLGFMLASPVDTPEEAIARFTEKPAKSGAKKKPSNKAVILSEAKDPCISPNPAKNPVILSEGEAAVEGPVFPSTTEPSIHAFLEDKYDGMRAQIHCGDPSQPGRVAIYSRNREDVTASFPELAEAFAHVLPDRDGPLILDGEILAWNFAAATEQTGPGLAERALPFATLGQRIGRKKVSNEWRKQVPVVFVAFDLMYTRGALILDQPLCTRRLRLEAIVEQMVDRIVSPLVLNQRSRQADMFLDAPAPNADEAPRPRLILAPSRLVESAEDIDHAYADARARANEGVMLKAANSAYQPGRRGLAWVKLKRELGSLDVVITGAEYGHGRRAGLLSDYTFAVRGPHPNELLNVGKAYSGVTDVEIAELTEFLKAHTLEDHGHFRTVEPLIMLEVAFNNIMRSERHASGFALRFPRILRIRTDKPLAEIDTLARVEEIYLSQVDRASE
jgi:DNA ligase-1